MKLELSKGCTTYGIFIDDENYYDVPKPEIRKILMQIVNQVDESDLYYILESILNTLGNYHSTGHICDQCGDIVETFTLEL